MNQTGEADCTATPGNETGWVETKIRVLALASPHRISTSLADWVNSPAWSKAQ